MRGVYIDAGRVLAFLEEHPDRGGRPCSVRRRLLCALERGVSPSGTVCLTDKEALGLAKGLAPFTHPTARALRVNIGGVLS